MRTVVALVVCLLALSANAQGPVQEPKGSFKLDLGLPVITGNESFSNVFKGLAQVGVSYQYNVAKGFVVGAGAKYNYFELNQFAFTERLRGSLHNVAPFLKLGYETFFNERVSVDAGVRGGYAWMFSYNDSTRIRLGGPYRAANPWVEPHVGVYIIADGRASFSMNVGYTVIFDEFDADYVSQDDLVWPKGGLMQYLTIGFGFSYYFGIRPVSVGGDSMD